MAEINELKTKRGRLKASVTKLENFLKVKASDNQTIEELQQRVEMLDKNFEEFGSIDDKLTALGVASEFSEMEDRYCELKPAFTKLINSIKTTEVDSNTKNVSNNVNNNTNVTNSLDVRLPQININCFSGEYRDWPSFKDLFIASVHNRQGLSDAYRFQYLKSFLKGEAFALVKHLNVTDANYKQAWDKLVERYDKKHQILNSYVKAFLNQPNIIQPSASSLRKLSDSSDEIIRGISALGEEVTGRDPWLIYLIINKTDSETKQAWAQHITEKKVPIFQDLLEFLAKRGDAMEAVDSASRKVQPHKNTIRTLHADTSGNCPHCAQAHQLYKYPQFKTMDTMSKRNLVSKLRLCFNCLDNGHIAQQCKSKFSCHFCKQLHHSSLHIKETNGQSSLYNSTNKVNHPGSSTYQSQNKKYIHTPTHNLHQSVDSNSQPIGNSYIHVTENSHNNQLASHSTVLVKSMDSNSQPIGNSHIHIVENAHNNQLALLPTALVHILDGYGKTQLCRLLIDSGSQATFMSEDCAQRLQLKRQKSKIPVQGVGGIKPGFTKGKVQITLASRFDSTKCIKVQAFILQKLTSPQPATNFDINDWQYIQGQTLADPNFNISGKIDILLGAEHFIRILTEGKVFTSSNQPVLQNTIFGYIIAGAIPTNEESSTIKSFHIDLVDIDNTLQKFWETEDIPQQESTYTLEEQFCENSFVETHKVDLKNNHYIVQLPINKESPQLGDSLDIAIRRMESLERRFQHNSQLYKDYCNFIDEYHQLGHLESIPKEIMNSNEEHSYLPHHAVIKLSSTTTKLRVVFDGSVKTSTGMSLNKKLQVGPKVQRDLFQILLLFRTFKIAVTSDVEKMYRMVLVDHNHRTYQRIIWRKNSGDSFQHLWLNTVTYGTASAPFLVTRALKQVAIEFKGLYPVAEKHVINSFYVDDLLAGANTVEEAVQLQIEISALLSKRGFQLRKWASNSKEFLDTLDSEKCSISSLNFDNSSETLKILGMKWIPCEDCFAFEANLKSTKIITKRQILSDSSRIFDPLGLLAPITVNFKVLLQQLWLKNYGWDDPINNELAKQWIEFCNSFHLIQKIKIPRWIQTISNWEIEMHGFSDALESAYSAVVYCRSIHPNGSITVEIVAAKTRASPIKQVSIPRLELCGALLLTKLMRSIQTSMGRENMPMYAWTDSTVVLSWLSSHPRKWKTYIGNRTSQILTILPRTCWNHISTKENPADIASRGSSPQILIDFKLWWNGPVWLSQDWRQKSDQHKIFDTDLEKRPLRLDIHLITLNTKIIQNLFVKHSSLRFIFRTIAWCRRFINNYLKLSPRQSSQWLTAGELIISENRCIQWVQSESFKEELHAIQQEKAIPVSSKLKSLNPFLDKDGLLRVRGRIENSDCSYNTKHPIILPKQHIFVKLLIKHVHEKCNHVGTSLLISILRQKYWILSCRAMVKEYIHNCVNCVKHRAETSTQLMGQLPQPRVIGKNVFENTGVDYDGTIQMLRHRGRGAKVIKGYIAIFVCFSTKALHTEIVSDLTSETFIACLKRFIARRGMPLNIYSDNGTNFVGANKKICDIYKLIKSDTHNQKVADYLSSQQITWHHNPPSAPHFGGLWEAGMKLIKTLLKKSIGETRLTFEELSTFVTEIEGILNSRPIIPITDDISNLNALTPAHFLIGRPITSLPDPSNNDTPIRTRWNLIQQMTRHFWKRWYLEYLTMLQNRPKWNKIEENLQPGDMVLIKENNLPPSTWLLGRIITTHPGKDSLVRVVTLNTTKGVFQRPVTKLVKLPIDQHNTKIKTTF